MTKPKNFCCVDDLSVIIPYRDLEKMVHFANNFDQFEERLKLMDDQLSGLRGLQSDLLEKIRDLEKSL